MNILKPFSLLIKPSSADCNLRCAYCFYLDRCGLYPDRATHRMEPGVLERMVASFMATDQPQHAFAWQGGEPTLMGLDFYRRAVELQQKFGRSGGVVSNGLQTNGTLIDAEWARFLATYRFLVGVSLDGPPALHDRYRVHRNGRGSHDEVMRGLGHLAHWRVEFNILVLVSQANVRHARTVYRYLCEQGFLYQQYIPCVECAEDGRLLPFSISGEAWGEFLCELYDTWREDGDTRRVSVRHFDSVLNTLVNGFYNVCQMDRNCCQYFVVEYNGDIYPCDFYVEAARKLGNLATDGWDDVQRNAAYRAFGALKAQWNAACNACPHLDLCSGDCLKHRLPGTQDPRTLSRLCAGWTMFYAHARAGLEDLAEDLRRERRRTAVSSARAATAAGPAEGADRPGRNAPCPCGSGKKYKRCCGRAG